MPPMSDLKFGPGTCRKHRELFVDVCISHGIRDWVTLEHLRLLFIAETARRFTMDDIKRWGQTACVGCEQEAHSVELINKLAAEERRLSKLL